MSKTKYYGMTKRISKVGNSQGIIFDAALMDLARLKIGDHVNVTVVPESGAIVVMPIRKGPSQKDIKSTIKIDGLQTTERLRTLIKRPRHARSS